MNKVFNKKNLRFLWFYDLFVEWVGPVGSQAHESSKDF